MRIRKFVYETLMPVSAEEVYRWHQRDAAFERLVPPGQPVSLLKKDPGLEVGVEVVIQMGRYPFCLAWHAEHIQCVPDRSFTDKQVKGPCSFWEHMHEMIPLSHNESILKETVHYNVLFGLNIDNKLKELFQYRHRIIKNDLDLSSKFPVPFQRIGVFGESSLLKTRLCSLLDVLGHEIVESPPFDAAVLFGNSSAEITMNSNLVHVGSVPLTNRENFKRYIQLIPSNIIWKTTGLLERLSRIPPWKRFLCDKQTQVQWIYLDDAAYGIYFTLSERSLQGTYVLASPEFERLSTLYNLFHSNSPFSWSLFLKQIKLKKPSDCPPLYLKGSPVFNKKIDKI